MMTKFNKTPSCYVHIPFCLRKCLFCSFTVVIKQEHRMSDYVRVLTDEAKAYQGVSLRSLYLGGGTPGYLPDEDLTYLFERLRATFQLESNAEITLETNPENVTPQKAKHLRQLGITRVSLGVQTMNDRYLTFLGRAHNTQKVYEAFALLREAGFNNISVDLMYGFPKQTQVELDEDIEKICQLQSEHISLYTLTIEPHSLFYAKHMKLDDDEFLAQQYVHVCQTLPRHGYDQYEISNFARRGYESTHNSHYWRGGEYIGLGVGAHGYLNGRRYWNTDKLQEYLTQEMKQSGYEDLTERTQLMERICFGLRTREGVDNAIIPSDRRSLIDQWLNDGLLHVEQGRLSATLQGQLVLDELSVRLL